MRCQVGHVDKLKLNLYTYTYSLIASINLWGSVSKNTVQKLGALSSIILTT